MATKNSFPWVLAFTTSGWLSVVAVGLAVLLQYSYTPGAVGQVPTHWPADTSLPFRSDEPNLIIFLHPKCPCSRATLRESARIMARCQERVQGRIVFVQPQGVAAGWAETDLWVTASAIPGVTVSLDADGRNARRFGALTSGHTFLFSTAGELVFSGGITSSRGHEGDNVGGSAIIGFLRSGQRGDFEERHFPVFGCPLLGS